MDGKFRPLTGTSISNRCVSGTTVSCFLSLGLVSRDKDAIPFWKSLSRRRNAPNGCSDLEFPFLLTAVVPIFRCSACPLTCSPFLVARASCNRNVLQGFGNFFLASGYCSQVTFDLRSPLLELWILFFLLEFLPKLSQRFAFRFCPDLIPRQQQLAYCLERLIRFAAMEFEFLAAFVPDAGSCRRAMPVVHKLIRSSGQPVFKAREDNNLFQAPAVTGRCVVDGAGDMRFAGEADPPAGQKSGFCASSVIAATKLSKSREACSSA